MGAVSNWVQKRFGVLTETRESVVVLNAATAVQVLQNDPNRFAWQMFNLGAGIAYVGFGANTTALRGLQINATGGNIGMDVREDLELPTHTMYAISSAATTLYILETVAI